jgi:type II secretory pathway pseudopilin PulG
LIELMITVTIIAILAAIGSYAYGRLTKRSRTNDAITFFASLAGAQTTYFDLYGQFGATDASAPFDAWDPDASDLEGEAADWAAPVAQWGQIGLTLPRQTWFSASTRPTSAWRRAGRWRSRPASRSWPRPAATTPRASIGIMRSAGPTRTATASSRVSGRPAR